MSDKKRFLEHLHRDMEMQDVLLKGIPEICPRSGNRVRKDMITMMNNVIRAVESDSLAGDWGALDYQILPLIRRTYWPEIAFELVTMQPMTMPTGKVVYLNDRYAEAQAGGTPNAITENARMDSYHSRTFGDSAEGSNPKQVGLTFASVTIDTSEKKFKGEWSIEAAQDAKAYLGIDMEAEHVRIIGQEARREIGNWIIYQLLTYATAGNVNWCITPPSGSDTVNTVAYAKRFWEAIVSANNLVFKKKYVNANFIVGHPDVIERLEKAEEYKITRPAGYNPNEASYGRHFAGTIDAGFGPCKIYKDPWFSSTTKLLVGFKGGDWMNAGAFWAPYIPMWLTPTWVDIDNAFTHKKGGITRYGKRADTGAIVLDGDYYATVTITTS